MKSHHRVISDGLDEQLLHLDIHDGRAAVVNGLSLETTGSSHLRAS